MFREYATSLLSKRRSGDSREKNYTRENRFMFHDFLEDDALLWMTKHTATALYAAELNYHRDSSQKKG